MYGFLANAGLLRGDAEPDFEETESEGDDRWRRRERGEGEEEEDELPECERRRLAVLDFLLVDLDLLSLGERERVRERDLAFLLEDVLRLGDADLDDDVAFPVLEAEVRVDEVFAFLGGGEFLVVRPAAARLASGLLAGGGGGGGGGGGVFFFLEAAVFTFLTSLRMARISAT